MAAADATAAPRLTPGDKSFQAIRENLVRLDGRAQSLEEFMGTGSLDIDGFNLSDIFEDMS